MQEYYQKASQVLEVKEEETYLNNILLIKMVPSELHPLGIAPTGERYLSSPAGGV